MTRRPLTAALLAAILTAGCSDIDDNRIPAVPVSINLSDAGMWNTYGVAGYGLSRNFIRQLNQPAGFYYSATTYTGYGGVLLIGGMDPYTGDTNVPLAYDLACPVECRPDVRVFVDTSTYEAVCPVCGSRYDVCMAAGAPTAGPALTGEHRYRLQPYVCVPSGYGGYIITRRN